MTPNEALALTNALLCAISLGWMLAGYRAIRRKRIQLHRRFMLLAVATQVLFAVCFIVRLAKWGLKEFQGGSVAKTVLLVIMVPHEAVAVATVPLVVCTVIFAVMGRVREHRQIAIVTLPIWTFVTVTGISVYVMLYVVGR